MVAFFPHLNRPELASVTLGDLLLHRARLQWKEGITTDWDLGRKPYPTKEFIHSPDLMNLIDQEAFGRKPDYSNLGYLLAGQIIEEKTGQSYGHLVSERLFKLHKLANIYCSFEGIDAKEKATIPVGYYDAKDAVHLAAPLPNLGICTPSGGIYASAPAISQFFQLLLDGEILSLPYTSAMRRGTKDSASIAGIYATPTPNEKPTSIMYGKRGGLLGYYSW